MLSPLTIAKPCRQSWNNMSAKTDGRYCDSCEKVVNDFTQMTDEELIAFIGIKKGNECGRFREDQVHLTEKTSTPGFKLKIAASFAVIFSRFLFPTEAKAQDATTTGNTKGTICEHILFHDSVVYKIKGKLIDKKTNEGLKYAAVNVEVNGSPVGGSVYTDADGGFELNVPTKNSDDVISFYFAKRWYKSHKVKNYTPDGKEMNIKMNKTRKGRHHRTHYVMGAYF